MQIREIMKREVVSCTPGESLQRAAELMWEHDCGWLPVVDGDHVVVGTVTDRDGFMAASIRRASLSGIDVGSVMARDVHQCGPVDAVETAARIMAENQLHRLPVVDEHRRLIGVVSLNDLAEHLQAKGSTGGLTESALVHTVAAVNRPRQH